MKLLFHKASPQHAAPLTALQHVCTDFLLAKGICQWTYMSKGDILKELPFTYVLLSNHTVVASFCIKPYEKDTAYATRIAVHPDYQGAGIGKAICTWLKGYEHPVYLDCWNGNEKLKSFYEENGGHIIGVFPEADYEICVFCF